MAAVSTAQAVIPERLTASEAKNLRQKLTSKKWRMSNLYSIIDEMGKKVPFIPNAAQQALWDNMEHRNIILKARQLGFTTFIQIFILDAILFTSNIRAGVIAHNKDDAQVFWRDKLKYAFDNLPGWLYDPLIEAEGLKMPRALKNDAGELLLDNNSSVRVGTSMRSGTIQILHVSEYGKICRKYPDKAKEIKTGAFPAVHEGSLIFVESTAEGRQGEFFDMCQEAQNREKEGRKQTPMDFKHHFFPWHKDKRYQTDPTGVVIGVELMKYFSELKRDWGIELNTRQMAWYAKRNAELGGDMFQEYPSTPEEPFHVAIEGAYFRTQMDFMRRRGRICEVPWEPSVPVNTFWDLGMEDETSIVFHQRVGREHRFIDFYANNGEGFEHYVRILKEKGYMYGDHYFPHDIEVRELGAEGRSRKESLQRLGLRDLVTVKRAKNVEEVLSGIEAVRQMLMTTWIDEVTCEDLIDALDSYCKDWDPKLATWKRGPRHDWASHPVDAVRCGAVGFKDKRDYTKKDLMPEVLPDY
jgi:hypothetical protein